MSTKEFMHISFTVSKLGSQIPAINLPPLVTCRPDAPCRKDGCYALRGHWIFKAVKDCLKKNLNAYYENPKLFFDCIISGTALSLYCRWFASGDIVDSQFFLGMCRVARINKHTQYLCFTKKFEIVNDYLASGKRIPSNLHVVFSTWGDFMPENPYNLPMTFIQAKNLDCSNIPESAIPCSGHCESCQSCWSLKKKQAVVFKKH